MSNDFQPGDSLDLPSTLSPERLSLSLDLNEAEPGDVSLTIVDNGNPAAQLYVSIKALRAALETLEKYS